MAEQQWHSPDQVSRAIYLLRTEADNHNRSLYDNNQAVYRMLRYGVPVKVEAGKVTETVHLINWKEPTKNDFVIVEEVTLRLASRSSRRRFTVFSRTSRKSSGSS